MKTKSAEEILNEAAQRKTFFVFRQALIDIRFRYSDVEKMVYEAMESYAAQFKPKWVPCSERLPEGKDEVLVYLPESGIKIGWVGSFKAELSWYTYGGIYSMANSYWMPLPNKPQLPNENKEE